MKRTLIITAITLLSILNLNAQRVGLVLSGGGAKGLYHVGLIKALEEHGIPIDYVSGASMGAIVGAMYVAGYSPDEMLHFFATDSVRTWLKGKIPDEYKYYFKKFEPTPQMVSFRLDRPGVNSKSERALHLPTNIISPYRIDLAFIKMLGPPSAAAGDNFDSLMVPFRCVAADTYNKKEVVFDSGSLAFAVRASMTIPMVFKPLKKDSILLYDGGVYNNFPWQTLEEDFHPDIMIGGVCSGNYKNPSESDILQQISVMITHDTDYSLRDSTDIIIRRRFPEVGILDYDKAAYIMARGYEDAMQKMPEILAKIKRRVTPQEMEEKRAAFRAKMQPLIYDNIEVEGLKKDQTEYVNRQLDVRPGSGNLTQSERFEEKYMRVIATDVFEGEFPELTHNPDNGYYQLKLRMNTRPSMSVSLGGNISSTSLHQLYIGFNYHTVGQTASNYALNGHLGTFYNAVDIGARHDFFTKFPFYIDYYAGFEKFDFDSHHTKHYYRNKAWRLLDRDGVYVGGSVAVPYLENSAARARVSAGMSEDNFFENYHTSQDIANRNRFYYAAITAELQNQTFNHHIYPTEGVNQLFQVEFRFGTERFTPGTLPVSTGIEGEVKNSQKWYSAKFSREQYFVINRWIHLGYLVEGVVSNYPKFATSISGALNQPAFTPTPISKTIFMTEYRSPAYVAAGFMPVFNITRNKNLYIKGYIYGFLPRDVFYGDGGFKKLSGKNFRNHYQLIFGANLVYQTIIGPASLSVTKFTTGKSNWNVMLNIGYNLFSSKKH